jgi:hypothetical protein
VKGALWAPFDVLVSVGLRQNEGRDLNIGRFADHQKLALVGTRRDFVRSRINDDCVGFPRPDARRQVVSGTLKTVAGFDGDRLGGGAVILTIIKVFWSSCTNGTRAPSVALVSATVAGIASNAPRSITEGVIATVAIC